MTLFEITIINIYESRTLSARRSYNPSYLRLLERLSTRTVYTNQSDSTHQLRLAGERAANRPDPVACDFASLIEL
jgi:hypothetical protein